MRNVEPPYKATSLRILAFVSALALLIVSASSASADHWPLPFPEPYTSDGYVYDVLGHPQEGAWLFDDFNHETFTSQDGYWVITSQKPTFNSRFVHVYKTVGGRDALSGASWQGPHWTQASRASHDFHLYFKEHQVSLDRRIVRQGAEETIGISAITYAPSDESYMRFISYDEETLHISEENRWLVDGTVVGEGGLDYQSTDSNGFSTWSTAFRVPAKLPEGRYVVVNHAYSLADRSIISRTPPLFCCNSYWVDGTAPSIVMSSSTHIPSTSAGISATISDGLARVDASSVSVSIGGESILHSFDESTGALTAHASGLAEGHHHVVIGASDLVGNETTESFTLTIDLGAPVISDGAPQGTISDRTPLIETRVIDEVGVDPSSVELELAGPLGTTSLKSDFDQATGWLAYQVPEIPKGTGTGEGPLFDADYIVTIRASDLAGNLAEMSFSFTIRSLRVVDMRVTDPAPQ